ncbi:ABC transporter permease [Dyadobacter pollutisoli]|uniref:ABC transporter permease n=1 Tax=Dyadobacter pollutisoli TaxID=2910158 RepID=A0A9E8N8H0_9BACT|nr:ABC transporter permease [Dyadobacter pollutisoli]WAC09852.1 ABC transporter permease [Dyadobacter pollutisoli]
MFKTFLKIAGRHLWQARLYACINITGLALGTICVLLAALFITDELRFDNFHSKSPNLYRITTTFLNEGKIVTTGGTGQVQGPAFQAQVPEVRHYTRVMGGDIHGNVRADDKAFKLRLLFVDDSFFDVFSFKIKTGDKHSALKNVNSVVVTEKTALKFFNRTDVVGRFLQMDADPSAIRLGKPLVISAVVEDPPINSSIQFDMLFPFSFMKLSFDDTSWLNAYLGTFVVLNPKADPDAVVKKFNQIHQINAKDQLSAHIKATGETRNVSYGLQNITDIHLNPQEISNQNRESGVINGSKPVYSYIFLGIAIFILLMASINFININIANSLKRAKEVGIRKSTGSSQIQILFQFLGESAILCFFTLILATLVTFALLPVFNELAGKQITWQQLIQPGLAFWILGILIFNTLASGLYPAYLLSGLSPVQVLYKKAKLSGQNVLGRGLVAFQFVIAILLGIATLVFYKQMHFIQSRYLGYNPELIVKMNISGVRDTHQINAEFRSELSNHSLINQLSLIGEFGFRETKVNDLNILSNYRSIDQHYLSMLEISLKEGRNFSSHYPSDQTHSVLVNEAFIKAANLSNPIGRQLRPDNYFGENNFTIVGIMKDFHYSSLKERIRPMIMLMSEQYGGDEIWVKINQNKQKKALSLLEKTFRKILPYAAFEYTFLNEQNALEYEQELRWKKIITYATGLSVLICSLGLFGLAHLATAQRTRETGIRVVLGATILDIALLFSKDFMKPILLAIVLACPVGYYLMSIWLAGFAYKISIPSITMILPGSLAVLIALITVCSQGIKATMADPVHSLGSE